MITHKDLVDISDKDYKQRQGEFMQCLDCDTEFGGTRGDYWQMLDDEAFQCPGCASTNIALVVAIRSIRIIKH